MMLEFVQNNFIGFGELGWLLLATLGVSMAFLAVHLRLKAMESKLHKRLERLKTVSTIETDSPLDDSGDNFREQGLESIHTRFRGLRRILYPILGLVWLVLVTVPLVDKIPAALISFLLGTVTVVVGIASRPFIENVIAGVVLAFTQPLRIGDTVLIDDKWGKVEDISLTYSIIQIWDWRRYVIPNSQLLSKDFINYSLIDTYQWAYVEFWVSYEADLDIVKELATEAASASPAFVDYEEPSFWVMEMAKDGIRCWVAGWTDTPAEGWALTNDIRTHLSMSLHRHGITCHSFNHRVQADAPEKMPQSVIRSA